MIDIKARIELTELIRQLVAGTNLTKAEKLGIKVKDEQWLVDL